MVVTGASSGIGRGVARAFARRGDHVVLLARGVQALDRVADECEARGGSATVLPVDVTDEAAVAAVVEEVLARLGRVDVWVGAAGAWSHGRFEDTPPEVFRQVVETTLMGQVHGVRAVLPAMRRQGSGVIVLLASLYGRLSAPYVSAYVAAKWGLVGLGEVLRQELRGSGVEVCTVLPGAVDTPIYRNAAVYVGTEIRPLPPVVPVRRVVRAVVRCADHPRRRVTVGWVHRSVVPLHGLLPAVYDRALAPVVAGLSTRCRPTPARAGNVFAPLDPGPRVDDGWRRHDARWATVTLAGVAGSAALLRRAGGRRG